MSGKLLSENAIVDIRRMKDDIRRILASLGLSENKDKPGPSHYLVLTPTGGIPAVDVDGVPGEAECQISRRWGTDKDVQDTSLKVKVYNASDQAIAEGVHVLAHRDAWGDYYSSNSEAGAGSPLIFIKAPSGGIPPRASNLLGSATCDKYVINNTGQLEDSTDDVTVVNWATTAVCANGLRYGVAAYIDNNWVVVSEDCGDESGPVQPQAGQYTSGTILSSFPDVESTVLPDFGSFTSGSHTRSTNITGGFE